MKAIWYLVSFVIGAIVLLVFMTLVMNQSESVPAQINNMVFGGDVVE